MDAYHWVPVGSITAALETTACARQGAEVWLLTLASEAERRRYRNDRGFLFGASFKSDEEASNSIFAAV